MNTRLAIIFLLLLTASCASRREEASNLVHSANWQWDTISGGTFDLVTARAPGRQGNTLWVYLEGDGLAYLNPTWVSSDPTPKDPMGLRFALAHPGKVPVAYIARPCQFVSEDHARSCDKKYWTTARYAPEVIDSTNKAIDVLKEKAGASRVVLVGYSGGGAVAVLAAAQRHDVNGIVTVAANLDTTYWTKHDELAPLSGSLNPVDVSAAVAAIPQIHFAGASDDVVTPDVVRAFRTHFPAGAPVHVVEVKYMTHTCCWADNWGRIITSPGIQSMLHQP